MNILIVHNRYLYRGGEDTVVESERALLESYGHKVELLEFHNNAINTFWKKSTFALFSIFNPSAYKAVREKINRTQADIVHVHNYSYVASPAVFYAAQSEGVPIVHTAHNFRLLCPSAILFHEGEIYENSVNKRFPWDAIFKGVFQGSRLKTANLALGNAIHRMAGTYRKKVDAFIVLTRFAKEKFLSSTIQIASEKFWIKPNFTADKGFNCQEKGEYFLYIGRLSPEKGLHTLLDAASKGDFQLKILGDGPLRSQVEQATRDNPNIQYLGFKSPEEVHSELLHCRALLLPSVCYDNMPMTILEAFAAGSTVIASNLGGPATMVTHEQDGLLFPPGNVEELLHHIQQLQHDPTLAVQMGREARSTYEKKFSPQQNYRALMDVYSAVLQKSLKPSVV